MITLLRYMLYYIFFSIIAFCGVICLVLIDAMEAQFIDRLYFAQEYPHD